LYQYPENIEISQNQYELSIKISDKNYFCANFFEFLKEKRLLIPSIFLKISKGSIGFVLKNFLDSQTKEGSLDLTYTISQWSIFSKFQVFSKDFLTSFMLTYILTANLIGTVLSSSILLRRMRTKNLWFIFAGFSSLYDRSKFYQGYY